MIDRLYLGVDVFFIISGYVIACSTANKAKADFGTFVIRRIFRIFPLTWLMVFLIILIKHAGIIQLARNLLFMTDAAPTNYLINPVQWTISFELMFYAIFSIALAISHRYRCEICISIVLLMAGLGLSGLDASLLNPAYLAEFASGVLLGRLLLRATSPNSAAVWHASVSTSLMILGSTALFLYVRLGNELVFSAAAVFLVSGMLTFEKCWIVDIPKPLVFLGEISFAIYISQHFAFMFVDSKLFWTPIYRTWIYKHTAGVTRLCLILSVLLALSCLLHFWVEQPGIEFGQRLAARRTKAAAGST